MSITADEWIVKSDDWVSSALVSETVDLSPLETRIDLLESRIDDLEKLNKLLLEYIREGKK